MGNEEQQAEATAPVRARADEEGATTSHLIRPLTPETYPAWLALAQKHNGVWGGCWCSYFHGDTEGTVKKEHDGPGVAREALDAEDASHRRADAGTPS